METLGLSQVPQGGDWGHPRDLLAQEGVTDATGTEMVSWTPRGEHWGHCGDQDSVTDPPGEGVGDTRGQRGCSRHPGRGLRTSRDPVAQDGTGDTAGTRTMSQTPQGDCWGHHGEDTGDTVGTLLAPRGGYWGQGGDPVAEGAIGDTTGTWDGPGLLVAAMTGWQQWRGGSERGVATLVAVVTRVAAGGWPCWGDSDGRGDMVGGMAGRVTAVAGQWCG